MKKTQIMIGGWIYNLEDYRRIFSLSDGDLKRKILDFPGGVSSFNAEMHALDHQVVSGDASYNLAEEEMIDHAKQILAIHENYLHKKHHQLLSDDSEANVQKIIKNWRANMEKFIQDYPRGIKEKRYQVMKLPKLHAEDSKFELALCSDLLFHSQARAGYTPQQLIDELCRIALEVRVFPLLDETGQITPSLGPIMLALNQKNFGVEVREVPYTMRKGGNAMLRIWSRECAIEVSLERS